MNFFEHQDQAKRKSGVLVFYFLLAVLVIASSVYGAAVLIFYLAIKNNQDAGGYYNLHEQYSFILEPKMFFIIFGSTLVFILLGSLFKILMLKRGGKKVAEMLGGRLIHPSTNDPHEKRVMNIVEEMAIASGVPVPPVYLLEDEEGINAFAAGFSTSDAVIGVTRGCITLLKRDELQGVIAHEFSHILNGDARLNLNLIGLVHGILLLALTGRILVRATGRSSSRSSSKKGNSGGAIILFGLALLVVGYIGVFFGKLIKSAVSRQREYLADASAVQFTRNPQGISGALKKVGGFSKGSKIENPKAEEASHLFFSNGLGKSFSSLLATHPPLSERISRIDPSFKGTYDAVSDVPVSTDEGPVSHFSNYTPQSNERFETSPKDFTNRIGTVTPEHLHYAQALLERIPGEVREKSHDLYGAQAVVFCLLLSEVNDEREAQLEMLSKSLDASVTKEVLRLQSITSSLGAEMRLPLVDLCLPALRELSEKAIDGFAASINALIDFDNKISLFEFALTRVLRNHLEVQRQKKDMGTIQYSSMSALKPELSALLSSLSHIGTSEEVFAKKAFDAALSEVKGENLTFLDAAHCSLDGIGKALDKLQFSAPTVKQKTLAACAACVTTDGLVTLHEAELLRAIADALNCPAPPFLPGQTV